VWIVRLDASERHFMEALSWLSLDETARAERFHFEKHRRAFVLGRAALRGLLGRYLGLPAAQISFAYGPKGKPALADATTPLRFNASNSGDLAVVAVAEGCELGVDVEQLRPVPEIESIAARFFAPEESAELLELPEASRSQGFFNCWTRKEAYIKAVGDGLSAPLDSFRVTLRPDVPARMLCLAGSTEAAQNWTLHEFVPVPGYAGALAYQDRPRPLLVEPLVTAEELVVSQCAGPAGKDEQKTLP
jgi:4'-phosphopantetheinyl transferase